MNQYEALLPVVNHEKNQARTKQVLGIIMSDPFWRQAVRCVWKFVERPATLDRPIEGSWTQELVFAESVLFSDGGRLAGTKWSERDDFHLAEYMKLHHQVEISPFHAHIALEAMIARIEPLEHWTIEYDNGVVEYYNREFLHREDGPAYTHPDGSWAWYLNGKLHRDGSEYAVYDAAKHRLYLYRHGTYYGERTAPDKPLIK